MTWEPAPVQVADAARMSMRSDTQSTLLDEGSQLAGAEESSVRPGAEGSSDQQPDVGAVQQSTVGTTKEPEIAGNVFDMDKLK